MNKDLAKIKLVYEFNHKSPLFARVAEAELNEGNIDKALEILDSGLEIYPDYLSAHLVFIEALAKKGDYKKVVNKLDELRPKLNDDTTINFYLDKIEKEKSENDNLETNIRQLDKPIEDNLDNLADTISKARIPPAEENQTEKNENFTPRGKQFISETLAEIYFSQSNYTEALEIYEKLLESNPNKAEHFKAKIAEIKNHISN